MTLHQQLAFIGANVIGRQLLTNYQKPLNAESASAVIEQLFGPANVDVVALAGIGSEVSNETHVHDRRRHLGSDHIFELFLPDIDDVNADPPRVAEPVDPVDAANLEILHQAAREQSPLASGDSCYENLFHWYSRHLRRDSTACMRMGYL